MASSESGSRAHERSRAPSGSHPTRESLLADFGEEVHSIQSLFQFCFVPSGRLTLLKELVLAEEWGANNFVLLKYLAVNVRLSIEQGCYVWNDNQLVLTVGRLATATGAPVYAGLIPNAAPAENPWVLNWVGERPSCTELPPAPDLGTWPELRPGAEVVVACDFSSEERRVRLPGLEQAPVAARVAAVAGAVQWALHRGLGVKQMHAGSRGFFAPVYLTSRDDLEQAPDFVAPIVAQASRIIVRTLLDPHVAWSPARAVVERWEQLPAWLVQAWLDAPPAPGAEVD